jgi:membrane protein involved in colicin uptake
VSIPTDEAQAKAARTLAVNEKAKAAVTRIKLQATDKASATAIAAAQAAQKRAKDDDEAAQLAASKANAVAERLEADVRKRQKHDADIAGGVNGILGRYYGGQNNAAMKPEDYGKSINHVNAALRRLVS